MTTRSPSPQKSIPVRELVIYAVLGTVMYISFAVMQGLPGVHLLGVFTGAVTLTYRSRALIPIYINVLLYGVFSGFSFWWLPYLYIWLPLWFAFMIIGRLVKNLKMRVAAGMLACALHGLSFGVLYAPAQALFFGLSFESMLVWIAAGLWFDVVHAISNFVLASLIIPLAGLLEKLSGVKRVSVKTVFAENSEKQVQKY